MSDFLVSLGIDAEVGKWVVAFCYALGGFFLGKIVAWISTNILRRISAKTKNHLDDILLAVIERPLVFALAIVGLRLGITALEPIETTLAWVNKVYYILLTISVAWAVAKIVDSVIEEYLVPFVEKTEGDLDDQLLPLLRTGSKTLIWVLACLVALNRSGYDVGALLAGLGIGGVAVALAAKDTLSNLFGSVAVLIDRPFRINERIKVSGFDGTVVEIGLRTSRLKTLDNRIVTIPNATFAATAIENVSSEPSTKIVETIDLTRASGSLGVEKAVAALRLSASGIEGLEPEVLAGFSGFSEAGLRITFVFFVKKGADYLGTLNAVNLAALRSLEAAGVELAAPAKVVLAPAGRT